MNVEIHKPEDLGRNQWRDLQKVARSAFIDGSLRDLSEIDHFLQWDNPELYYQTHINPNILVGDGLREDQEFHHLRVAIAVEEGKPIGFATSAHNVSGESEKQRALKRRLPFLKKNYVWMREIAVVPAHQRQGTAKALGHKLLSQSLRTHPITAYVWPEENMGLYDLLKSFGFEDTGRERLKVFGEDTQPVVQARMQARSVDVIKKKLY